jgi:hypothetical protein
VEKRVSRSRQQAKALLDAGKLDEAAAAVGEALQLDPSDAQARRLLAEIDQRARKTAESAADAVSEARAKAVQARAAELAADSFETARQADQEGTRLLAAKRFAPAARILGEAAESYRRADAEARSEAARRAELERRAQVVPPAPPTVDEAALAAQRLLEDTRRGLEAAKRGAPADSRAAAEESAAQELVRQGRLAEAAAALKRAGSLYEAARLVERDRAAVLGALQRYRTALEGKDMGALKELWPTLAGAQEKIIRQSFQFTRSMRVELQPQDVQLAGDQATVRCQRRDEMVSVDGQKAQTDTQPTFVMRRKGESWLIETIR